MTCIGLHIIKFLIFRCFAAVFLFFAVFYSVTCDVFASADKTTIYFYNSETTINNFKSLKMEFDRYLGKFGPYAFQTFSIVVFYFEAEEKRYRIELILSCWFFYHCYGYNRSLNDYEFGFWIWEQSSIQNPKSKFQNRDRGFIQWSKKSILTQLKAKWMNYLKYTPDLPSWKIS